MRLVHWLGFENCKFNGVPHENNHGYEPDRESEFGLGKNCRYSHVKNKRNKYIYI